LQGGMLPGGDGVFVGAMGSPRRHTSPRTTTVQGRQWGNKWEIYFVPLSRVDQSPMRQRDFPHKGQDVCAFLFRHKPPLKTGGVIDPLTTALHDDIRTNKGSGMSRHRLASPRLFRFGENQCPSLAVGRLRRLHRQSHNLSHPIHGMQRN